MQFIRTQSIEQSLAPKRALIMYGPRRVGKTTLLQSYLATQRDKRIYSSLGDDFFIRELFASESLARLTDFARPYDIIAIDEAQRIPSLGLSAKMLVDTFPEKQFIYTGSSSFEIKSAMSEALTGRHFTLTLFPIAQSEFSESQFTLTQSLESFLVYGSYPEVLLAPDSRTKERVLQELASSYLYRDFLSLEGVRSPDTVRDLTRMLALQVGNEVSLQELAVGLKIDSKTVARYLDLLEKMFVIQRVRGYSGNLRNEISKKARYYFLDNGVRNAILGNFSPLATRGDVGALWENFVAMELRKRDTIRDVPAQYYFWRTHAGAEVDIIREHNGALTAYECKWAPCEARVPKAWRTAYPESTFHTIHRENYLDFLLSAEDVHP